MSARTFCPRSRRSTQPSTAAFPFAAFFRGFGSTKGLAPASHER